jgi:MerR family mercuric resistance operon transcriptional regulator
VRAGQLAAAAGVNLQTLRYYERRGLLAPPDRTLGGHRDYPERSVTVLRVIKTAQRLGFTLTEIADLLDSETHRHDSLRRGGHRQNSDRPGKTGLQSRAAAKLAEVEQKIDDLTVIRESLLRAMSVGCDDLVSCAQSPQCPLPFANLAAGAAN